MTTILRPWLTLSRAVLTFSGALVLSMPAAAAHDISWMYEADVPVLNQSQQARVQAAEVGFRQVLGRLTGQGEAGLTLKVAGATADRLMTRFSYHSQIVDGRRQPRVKFSFNPSQTLATVRNAGLPVWGTSRPAVKLYLLHQEPDGTWVQLAAAHPVRQAMERQAWVRGLVLGFPAFSEERVPVHTLLEAVNPNRPADPATLASDDVVAGIEPAVDTPARPEPEPATANPDAVGVAGDGGVPPEPPPEPFLPGVIPLATELVLVGEFRTLPPPADVVPGPAFSWAIGPERGVIGLPLTDAPAQAVQLVDHVADVLASRLAVPWVDPVARPLRVASVHRIPSYAGLMRYLGRQEVFARVDLLEAGPRQFTFSVVTPASADLLARLFAVDGRLLPEADTGPVDAGESIAGGPGRVDATGLPAAVMPAVDTAPVDTMPANPMPVFVWQD